MSPPAFAYGKSRALPHTPKQGFSVFAAHNCVTNRASSLALSASEHFALFAAVDDRLMFVHRLGQDLSLR